MDEPCSLESGTDWVAVWGSLALSLVTYLLFARAVMGSERPPPAGLAQRFIPELRESLRPEPTERTLFIVGLLSAAILPVFYYALLQRFAPGTSAPGRGATDARWLACRDVVLVGGLAAWLTWLTRSSQIPNVGWYLGASLGLAACVSAWRLRARAGSATRAPPRWHATVIGVAMVLVLALAWRTQFIGEGWFLNGEQMFMHVEVIFGAVRQVLQGRTILVDTTSQYGVLYPYVAALFVAPFGLSVEGLSLFLATLVLIQLGLTLLAVARRTGLRSLWSLFFLCAFVGLAQHLFMGCLFNGGDALIPSGVNASYQYVPVYYQYAPLRTVWGSVFFWLVPHCFGPHRTRAIAAGYALAGASLLWNADVGVVILLAWTGALVYAEAGRWRTDPAGLGRHALAHAALLVATAAGATGAYSLFALLRSGRAPDLAEWSRFQSVFYGAGMLLTPMPLGELWQAVVLVYVVTVAWCGRRAVRGEVTPDAAWKFFIAVFGLGALSYYQARSSVTVLMMTCYPVVLLSFLWMHEGLRALRGVSLREVFVVPAHRYRLIQVVGYSLWCCFGALNFGRSLPRAVEFARDARGPRDPAALDTMFEALRREVAGRPVVVLSVMSSYICEKIDATSALPLSSANEAFLMTQVAQIQRVLEREDVVVVIHVSAPATVVNHLDLSAFTVERRLRSFRVLSRPPLQRPVADRRPHPLRQRPVSWS